MFCKAPPLTKTLIVEDFKLGMTMWTWFGGVDLSREDRADLDIEPIGLQKSNP